MNGATSTLDPSVDGDSLPAPTEQSKEEFPSLRVLPTPVAAPDSSHQASEIDLSSVTPLTSNIDLSHIEKVKTFAGIPEDEHDRMQFRAEQRLLNNPQDERAATVLGRQQAIGWLPEDHDLSPKLPEFDSSKTDLGIGTGAKITPLSVDTDNAYMDRYLEKLKEPASDRQREISERLLQADMKAEISLPRNYREALVRSIYSPTTPFTEIQKFEKGMSEASWSGAKEALMSGASTAGKAVAELLFPAPKTEEAALRRKSTIGGGLVGGAARFVGSGVGLLESGINAADYALGVPGHEERRFNRIVDQIELTHNINKAKKTVFPLAEEDTPLSETMDFAGAMALPGIGLEGAITRPISKLASKIVEKVPTAVGRTAEVVGKGLRYGTPGLVAEEIYRRGYNPLYAVAALTGYAPWLMWKKNILEQGFKKMADIGKAVAEVPEGITMARGFQNVLDKEIAYTQKLEKLKRDSLGGKPTLADDPAIRSKDLGGVDKQIRDLQDKAAMLQRRHDFLDHAVGLNKILRDTAKIGLASTGLTLATGPVLGALSASGALPSEMEQAAKKGTEAGYALGAVGSPVMAIRGFQNLRFQKGREAMAARGENILSPDMLDGLTPEQQQAAKVVAAYHDLLGKKYVPISREDAAAQLSQAGEPKLSPSEVPNGWIDGDTSYVVKDKIPTRVSGHEFDHHVQETYGRILSDKDPEAMKAFWDKYQNLLKKSGQKTISTHESEREAEVGRIVLQNMPPEMFYGGETGPDVVKRGLSTFLADKFPSLFDRTRVDPVLGAPYSQSDINAKREQYFGIGEKAILDQSQERPTQRSGASPLSPEETQARQDAIDIINSVNKNRTQKSHSEVAQQVDQAVSKMKQAGQPIDTQKIIAATQTRLLRTIQAPIKPKIAGPALTDDSGKVIEKGAVGETHADLMKRAVNKGITTAIDAFQNDSNHVFVDDAGKVIDRAEAAKIAVDAGQAPAGTEALQSENLTEAPPRPVSEFEQFRQSRQTASVPVMITKSMEADLKTRGLDQAAINKLTPQQAHDILQSTPPADILTKEEIAALHRAQERGDIKTEDDFNRWIENATQGQRGELLRSVKTFQDNQQPFTVTWRKSDGSLRTMRAQFGVQKDLKGGKKSTAGNPALYTVMELNEKGEPMEYRTFDIDRVQSIAGEGVDYNRQFMPSSGREEPRETRFSEKITSPAIRVADIPFVGKTYEEAQKAARDFGFEAKEVDAAEKGYTTNKGRWLTPDEASTFTAENRQMGGQASERPLRTQDFNRWRRYMPSSDNPELVNLGNGLTPEENKRYLAIKAKPEPTTQEADEFSALTDKIDAYTEAESERGRRFMPASDFARDHPPEKYDRPSQPFYSQLERTIASQPNRASPEQLRAAILKGPGVKQAELRETKDQLGTSFDQWLKDNPRASKQQMLDFVRENQVQVKEKTLGGAGSLSPQMALAIGNTTPQDANGWIRQSEKFERVAQQWQRNGDENQARRYFDLSDEATRLAENLETPSGIEAGATKFSQYQLSGGTDYGETLVTLPSSTPAQKTWADFAQRMRDKYGSIHTSDQYTEAEQAERVRTAEAATRESVRDFRSPHWDEPNVVLHLRHNIRELPNSKKAFFIEELQSDWAQKGRSKGYASDLASNYHIEELTREKHDNQGKSVGTEQVFGVYDKNGDRYGDFKNTRQEAEKAVDYFINADKQSAVPDLPFKGNAWKTLGLKVALRKAIESGADSLGWTTGEQQAERYDLSKHLDTVVYTPRTQRLEGYAFGTAKDADPIIDLLVPPEKLVDHIGKEAADKIANSTPNKAGHIFLSNQDLKIGGEGMKGFYDKELVNLANDLVKKWGVRVGSSEIKSATTQQIPPVEGGTIHRYEDIPKNITIHSLHISDAMRRDILEKGQPLFMPESNVSASAARPTAKIRPAPVAQSDRKKKKKSTVLKSFSEL